MAHRHKLDGTAQGNCSSCGLHRASSQAAHQDQTKRIMKPPQAFPIPDLRTPAMLVQMFNLTVNFVGPPAPVMAHAPALPKTRQPMTIEEHAAMWQRVEAMTRRAPVSIITSQWSWSAPFGGQGESESGTFYT